MTALNPVVATHAPLTIFCYAVFFAATLLFARRNHGITLIALLTPAVINSIVLLLQWRTIWTPVRWNPVARGRFHHIALQGNPDPAGMYLMIPAIAAIAAAFAFRKWRWPLVAVSALLLVGLLLTESITVFVSFIVVVRSNKARIAMMAMLLAGVTVLAVYAPTRHRARNIARWMSQGRYQEVTSFRLPAWSVAVTMFSERPLVGVGPGGYAAKYMSYKLAGDERHPEWMTLGNTNFGEAHNDHLQLLAEAGLPGYALFLAFAGSVALLSWRVRKRTEEPAVFVGMFALPAVVGFSVAALAQFPMHLTAPSSVAVFAAALCHAWGSDDVGD
jgi:O-antigen ligase